MKTRFLYLGLAAALLSACDPNSAPRADDQRQADEKRLAELRDLEQRAAHREADAHAAEIALERRRLADDQAGLDAEKQKLAAEKAAIQEDAQKLEQWRANEQRLQQRQAALKADQERSARAADEASAARERALEAGRQAQQESAQRHLDYFHAPLDPLGDWIEVAPYGYCWQPKEARTAGWRPYTDGNWAFTDYGWTWNANEQFGWATYHYGRWARIKRLGWVWVPGSEWAPAWVAWRRSEQYVGWAPLPPEAHSGTGFNAGVDSYYDIGPASYNFVPVANFGEPTYRGLVVEPERNVTIINQTVNVTKINYTTVENRTVVFNGGPELVQVNAASARPVRRLTVERIAERPAVGGPAIVGNVLKLLAPRIASASKSEVAPRKVKEVVKAAEVERGWSGGDAVQAVRAQIVQEARKAEQQQARGPTPVVPARERASDAEAARISAAEKADAERANAIQAEAQKKAVADRATDAAQQREQKREAERAKAAQAAAGRKAMTEPAPIATPRERSPRPGALPRSAEPAAATENNPREKGAAALKPFNAAPPSTPAEAATSIPAAPATATPAPMSPPETKTPAAARRDARAKEKAARETTPKPGDETQPAPTPQRRQKTPVAPPNQ